MVVVGWFIGTLNLWLNKEGFLWIVCQEYYLKRAALTVWRWTQCLRKMIAVTRGLSVTLFWDLSVLFPIYSWSNSLQGLLWESEAQWFVEVGGLFPPSMLVENKRNQWYLPWIVQTVCRNWDFSNIKNW